MTTPDPPVTPTLAEWLSDALYNAATERDQDCDAVFGRMIGRTPISDLVAAVLPLVAALTPEPVTPPASAPPDDATLLRAALAGDYAHTGTTLSGVSPADRSMDHMTRTIGPPQHVWAAQAQANRCEAIRRVLAGDPRDPQAIADEIAPRVSWTGVGTP